MAQQRDVPIDFALQNRQKKVKILTLTVPPAGVSVNYHYHRKCVSTVPRKYK
jgi:hypothetical protein